MATATQLGRIIGEDNMTSTCSGLKALLIKTTASPRHRLDIPRSREQVSKCVREVIRSCCEARSPWPLALLGLTGVGKTCAALALTDHVRCSTRVVTMAELCGELIDAQQGRLYESIRVSEIKVTPERFWRQWSQEGLTVLDEIAGRRNVSDHHREVLQRALDTREGKPMIVTANLMVDEIGELYDDRIASRLTGGTVLWIDGEDRRTENEGGIGGANPLRPSEDEKETRRRQRIAEEREYRDARAKRKRFGALFATLPSNDQSSIVSEADADCKFSNSHMFDTMHWRENPFKYRMVSDACVRVMERRGIAPLRSTPNS